MNVDGSDIGNLTDHSFDDEYPAWSPDGTKIAFMSREEERNWDIFLMNADGSGRTQLTESKGNEVWPAWSPDGTQIVYANQQKMNGGLYVMAADGSDKARITTHQGATPDWSPDGSQIVFSGDNYDIYVIDADGTDETNLTDDSARNEYPKWAPDGERIIYQSRLTDTDETDIYVMNADGSDRTKVTENADYDLFPEWIAIIEPFVASDPKPAPLAESIGRSLTPSPVRTTGRLAFASYLRDAGSGGNDIFVINGDGSGVENITKSAGNDHDPAWSPDGSHIAFLSDRGAHSQFLWGMDTDGSNQKRLSSDSLPSGFTWSPDGTRIAYTGADRGLHVVSADGSEELNLTSASGSPALAPVWSPDGSKLAFFGAEGIWVMGADGSSRTQLSGRGVSPAWSPDGDQIAFVDDGIWIMDAEGSRKTRLTEASRPEGFPRWSPDGSRIAFISLRDCNWEIYVVNADGTGLTNMAINPEPDGDNGQFAWSPDGTRIVFVRGREDQQTIWVANGDGSGEVQLTDVPADSSPTWAPIR